MAMLVTNVGRQNQNFPRWDVQAVNNSGAALRKGDLVLLDWVADGIANSVIACTTVTAFNNYRKCVCKDVAVASGALGNFRLQGPLGDIAIAASNGVITQGMGLTLASTVATGGAAFNILSAQAIGTVGVTPTAACAWAAWKGSAFDGGTVGGTLAGAGTVGYPGSTLYSGTNSAGGSMTIGGLFVFDGSDCNAPLIKD